MTTQHKDPRAVIEQLVTALEKLLGPENYESEDLVNAWTALTAGRDALEQQATGGTSWRPAEAALTALRRFEETCADGEGKK